ncbi:hypothetical protein TeGR_g3820, partial [Tetraparma gracilis]
LGADLDKYGFRCEDSLSDSNSTYDDPDSDDDGVVLDDDFEGGGGFVPLGEEEEEDAEPQEEARAGARAEAEATPGKGAAMLAALGGSVLWDAAVLAGDRRPEDDPCYEMYDPEE